MGCTSFITIHSRMSQKQKRLLESCWKHGLDGASALHSYAPRICLALGAAQPVDAATSLACICQLNSSCLLMGGAAQCQWAFLSSREVMTQNRLLWWVCVERVLVCWSSILTWRGGEL